MRVKIRPMTDLAKKMDEIEDLCINKNLPVYITKKGSERLVVLSHEKYESLVADLERLKEENELYQSLIQAAGESRRGEGREINDFMNELDNEIRELADDAKNTRKISS
ncbi:hypothetical protein [Sporolituus thermophilus]|uniref:Antitoxin Phd_YefM, type II toxin-antitoxin system n=1 Tax=Sporolituus thermophilus DSM 23256 TaxID=1123285 RepID=A0A1G7L7T3_9FIRM|nr:hypothetical protein [Sporolituus thermophilus]SDF45612.1 Antitoxin Phd_YefM, type II toxin-antitoxin system [Sporolituus thermophilus DSM 23256]